MADGYGFGGEGDWKTVSVAGHGEGHGRGQRPGTSFMEDYTYHFGPGEPKILGAHMLEVCPTIAADTPVMRDPPARHRRPRGPGTAGLRCRPGPAVVIGIADMGDRFRLVANAIEIVPTG